MHLHIPLQSGRTVAYFAQALQHSENNGTWDHIATAYYNDEPTYHLTYRLAHPHDLGRPNNGKHHSLGTQSARLHGRIFPDGDTVEKRLEAEEGSPNGPDGEVIIDYI
jgi:hypothetical protein